MNYIEFIKMLRSKNVQPTYIFQGDEKYLMDIALEEVIKTFLTKDLESINLSNLDGKTNDFGDLISSCETLPFMSTKRVIVLKNPVVLVEKDGVNEDMIKFIENLGDHQILIVFDSNNDIKKNTKLYKSFSKRDQNVNFEKLKGTDLNNWISKKINALNKTITPADINYLIQQSSYLSRNITTTLYDLDNEIKKLVDYSKDDKITKELIDNVLVKTLDKSIFDLLAAISRKDADKAIALFDDIYMMNEPIPKILFMISRQFRLLLGYNVYKNRGYGQGEIQSKLGIKPYEFTKVSTQGGGYSEKDLEDILERILETDRILKTRQTDDKLIMEILLVNLCTRK